MQQFRRRRLTDYAAYRRRFNSSSSNCWADVITRVPPRYCVDARIRSIRFWPMSVFESSTAPAVSEPMPDDARNIAERLAGVHAFGPQVVADLLQTAAVGEPGHQDLAQVARHAVRVHALDPTAFRDRKAGQRAGRETILARGLNAASSSG